MSKKTFISIIIVVFFISVINTTSGTGQNHENAAVSSAEKWLSSVDEGRYEKSWEDSADFFRNAVTKEQWLASMKSFRSPLGRLISRKMKSKQHTTSLPGAPDGDYVVIRYETSFQNKKSAVETITPMLDKDGIWRVSGYYIK